MTINSSASSRSQRPSAPQVRLLSLQNAATFLSLSYWTVRELVWRGELPAVKVGRRVLIDREDLEDFIERSKEQA